MSEIHTAFSFETVIGSYLKAHGYEALFKDEYDRTVALFPKEGIKFIRDMNE